MKNKSTTTRHAATCILNEDGSVLLVTVIMLMLITIIGVSGINTSSTDIQISRNYRIQKMNVALADAAVNRAKSLIVYGQAVPGADNWVNDITTLYDENPNYLKDGTNWEGAAQTTPDPTLPPPTNPTPVLNEINVPAVIADWDTNNAIRPATMPGEPDTQFVVYTDTLSTNLTSVVIVRSRKQNGDVIIEAGFNDE